MPRHVLSRRDFLRGAALGGAGLLGASILGCGDDGGGSATADPTLYATPGGNATLSAPNMAWTRIAPTGSLPPARFQHTLITDGSKLYLFGGQSGDAMNDLWVYDAGSNTWTRLDAQSGPPARFGHNAVWDSTRSKVVIFGGQNGTDFYNNLSEYDPATNAWNDPLAGADPAALPGARYGAASCLDEAGHLLITHGSNDVDGFDDTWQFDLASPGWSDVSPPTGQERPSKRGLIDGAWDTRKQRLLVYGGSSIDGTLTDDLWGFSPEFSGWQQVARLPRPSPRSMYSLVYNADKTAATLIGGRTAEGQAGDTWFFSADGETWAEAAPQGGPLVPRYGHDAAIMPDGTIYLFGGTDGATPYNDLWRLEISG